jgi:hypothetical protein
VDWLGPDHDLARVDAWLVVNCRASVAWKMRDRLSFNARAYITPPDPVTGLKAVRNGGHVRADLGQPAPAPDLR